MMNNELENIRSRFENYLPEFILKAPYLNEIFNSEIFESYYLNKYAKELLNELSISTVTERSINKWEKFAGLNNENLKLKERIDTIIKKFSFQIHANYFNFLSMLISFDQRTELEEFINGYRILIKTYTPMSYANLLNFMDIIHNYKPAHIGFNLEIYRDIYKNTNKALILQNTKYTNINIKPYSDKAKTSMHTGLIVNKIRKINTHISIKPYSDKAKTSTYTGLIVNKTREINTHIKVVSDKIQKPLFMGSLVNKIKNKEVNIKFNTKNQGNYFNSLILNSIKIREVNFNRESKFKSFSSDGIIINRVKIRRCTIE